VIAAEASAVHDAMRLRGIGGWAGLLRHPVLGIERFTVPLIASSLRVGEDLSASALLRGLGSADRPTAMNPPRFGRADVACALVVAVLVAGTLLASTLPTTTLLAATLPAAALPAATPGEPAP
jgi:energy-coupling factor transport system permease protein